MKVIVKDLAISYERSGTGSVLLLIHGWADTDATFKDIVARLSDTYDCIVVDLPGFGSSDAPKDAWGLTDYAACMADFLNKLGVQEVHAVIGHSNGGAIAITALAKGFIHADSMVLIGSAGIRAIEHGRKRALKVIAKTGKVMTIALPGPVRSKVRRRFYDRIGSDLLVAPHMQETFKRIVNEDVRVLAKNITEPTLLIYGELDTATPTTYGQLLHDTLHGSTYEIIGGAGHFVHQEQGPKLAKMIEEFIR